MDMIETDETEWPPHLEALVAAPANHRLLHEDDKVRVLETSTRKGMRSRPRAERRLVRRCREPSACRPSGHMPPRSPPTRHIRFAGSGSNARRRKHRCHKRAYGKGLLGSPSFDHLVGAGEERGRDRQAERVRRLQIDRQPEHGWLLDG
jgi:hypothetical protein